MWGSAFVGIKAGLPYFPPILFAALRWDIATVLMFGYVIGFATRIRPIGMAEWFDVLVSGGLIIGAFQALLFLGELYTTSAVAAILVSTSPILVTAFSRIFLPDERLSRLGVLGLLVGFIGVWVITRPDPRIMIGGEILGELLIVASAVAFALGSVLIRIVEEEVTLPIESREAWAMVIGAVMLHVTSAGVGETSVAIDWTVVGIASLLYLGIVPSALGYLVYFDLLDRLGPIDVNLVSYVNPVFTAIIGWLVLGESVDLLTVAGFLFVFFGFVLLKRKELTWRLSGFLSRNGTE